MNKTVFITLLFFAALAVNAQITLPNFFADHMVLQRNTPCKIWGETKPNQKISCEFMGKTYISKSDKNGNWEFDLGVYQAGGPYQMTFTCENKIKKLNDIYFGEVWIASGQSNMALSIKEGILNKDEEIKNAQFNKIRIFVVKDSFPFLPKNNLSSNLSWQIVNPDLAADLPSTPYFFARELYQKYKIPIGIVSAAVGGTYIYAWMGRSAFLDMPNEMEKIKRNTELYGSSLNIMQAYQGALQDWIKTIDIVDPGMKKAENAWQNENYDDQNWDTISAGVGLQVKPQLKNFKGLVWFRKSFNIETVDEKQKFLLSLGKIDDFDITYVNGKQVGFNNGNRTYRKYEIDANILHKGKNTIAIRVVDYGNVGGLIGEKDSLFLQTSKQNITSLSGTWKYKETKLQAGRDFSGDPVHPNCTYHPTVLYNGMIAPLKKLGVKGVIWYQGEANEEEAFIYRKLLQNLIKSWRLQWGKEIPFLITQLANFRKECQIPEIDSKWAMLRESQQKASFLPNVFITTAIDIGNPDDIHPGNKQEVGKRFAKLAFKYVYKDSNLLADFYYKTLKIEGSVVKIDFFEKDLPIKNKDKYGNVTGFALAGEDKIFYWAQGKILNNQIIITSNKVEKPVSVRYAWCDNPGSLSIVNSADIPLMPFRNDEW